jgi:hypothetical protein
VILETPQSTPRTNLRTLLASATNSEEMVQRNERQQYHRAKHEVTRDNIARTKEVNSMMKSKSGASLRCSLLEGTVKANKLLEEEVYMRNILKECTRGTCQDGSSSLVRASLQSIQLIY